MQYAQMAILSCSDTILPFASVNTQNRVFADTMRRGPFLKYPGCVSTEYTYAMDFWVAKCALMNLNNI